MKDGKHLRYAFQKSILFKQPKILRLRWRFAQDDSPDMVSLKACHAEPAEASYTEHKRIAAFIVLFHRQSFHT